MALSKLPSVSLEGISGSSVTVEVDVANGLPSFTIVGLADKSVEESRERVRSAIKHTGFTFPLARLTVHLAPSHKRKSGIHFDLPIALGILAADGQLPLSERFFQKTLVVGGLGLDGSVQAVPGVLVMVDWAKSQNFEAVVLPSANLAEARLVDGIKIIPLSSLRQVVSYLQDGKTPSPEIEPQQLATASPNLDDDWLQIQGQTQAKRAAIIAAAGGHNLLMSGPPGAGKTLIAKGVRALLPPLSSQELTDVVKIHSVAGLLTNASDLSNFTRPFHHPHHTASHIAVIGGGSGAKPGEISLAHHGVLLLDELPEFPRSVLEALRQPLEDGSITVARIASSATYPAEFIFIATMNPCPCGWYGSESRRCKCTPHQISQYRKKISGPILDRIDLCVRVGAVALEQLRSPKQDNNELIAARESIRKARATQFARNGGRLNAFIPSKVVQTWTLDAAASQLIEAAGTKMQLTGRSYHKILKVARTIADLAGESGIGAKAVAEALQYRFLDDD